MVYTTKDGQTPLDLAVQLTGSLDALVGLMASNGLGLTAPVAAGTDVACDEASQRNDSFARALALSGGSVVTHSGMREPNLSAPVPAFTRLAFPRYVPAPNDYTATDRQSTIDLALQLYGSLDNLVELCAQNGFSLSQMAPVGVPLAFDPAKQSESVTASDFALKGRYVVSWSGMNDVTTDLFEFAFSELNEGEFA